MDAETGKVYEIPSGMSEVEAKKEKILPESAVYFPRVKEVYKIRGCNFVITKVDTEKGELTLKLISNKDAKFILMGGTINFNSNE
jgi:hydroxymethylpyrimidine/phosphomethylpyrimidine kinase